MTATAEAPPAARPLVERYLLLSLGLGRLVDGFVDAYHGPEALARAAAEAEPDAQRLAAEAEELLDALDGAHDLEESRRRWLLAQVRACRAVAEREAGLQGAWSDEVERCFGIRPSMTPESDLAHAHRLLDDVLPGGRTLAERALAWQESQRVPREQVLPAAELLRDRFREQARELIELPAAETTEIALVEGEPWSAYHDYLGNLRSRVSINVDTPIWTSWLAELVGHELYPGHHTERVRKDTTLVAERGYLEETVTLTLAPQSLVAEGIAMLGLEVAYGGDVHRHAAEALAELGLRYDAEVAAAIESVERTLEGARVNAAFLLHEEGVPLESVRDYLAEWTLRPPDTVERMLAFATDPTWRTYVATYVDGLRICRAFVGGDTSRFARLLSEQLVPGDLTAAAAGG